MEADWDGSNTQRLNVFCASCGSQLGYYYFRTLAVTLFKWQLSCDTTRRRQASPTVSECLASTLTASMSRCGSSKSLVVPIFTNTQMQNGPVSTDTAIHIWILNSSIKYVSTRANGSIPAIKLLYRLIPKTEADRELENITSDAQEISLPNDAVGVVIKSLEDTNGLLPAGERVFNKQWKVGLLKRWEPPTG
jgi:hypothetical protein